MKNVGEGEFIVGRAEPSRSAEGFAYITCRKADFIAGREEPFRSMEGFAHTTCGETDFIIRDETKYE